jgi:hypothetical protein
LTADLGKEQCQWMDALWQLRSQTWQWSGTNAHWSLEV